jgi:hypothetical protein
VNPNLLKGEYWISRQEVTGDPTSVTYLHFSSFADEAVSACVGLRFGVAKEFIDLVERQSGEVLK